MVRFISIAIIGIAFSQAATAERPSNEIPMYGGEYEPTVEINPAFSQDAAARGWKAYYQGDLDTAIKRFNQGWMFDRENPDVYWGFGLIMGQRAQAEGKPSYHLQESIKHLEKALDLDGDNQKMRWTWQSHIRVLDSIKKKITNPDIRTNLRKPITSLIKPVRKHPIILSSG